MITPTTPRIAAAAVGMLMLLAGCTTPTPSATPTATPTPSVSMSPTTPTATPPQVLSADQQAAVDALTHGDQVTNQIGRDPSAYSEKQIREMLGKVKMPPLLANSIQGRLSLKEKGYREAGESIVLWVKAAKVERVDGALRVVITRCIDQRTLQVVDQSGAPAPADWQYPQWHLQESAMRKTKGVWKAAGTRPASTTPCGGAR